ncbi:MAG: hypothetical protein ABL958_10330 [Bdellovibrionia bacterium]
MGKWLLLLSLTWGVYLTYLFSHMLEIKPDGVYAGHPYVWADWALHIGMANVFAHNDPQDWFKFHPVYAGAPLNYPFLTNLISGLLMRAGLALDTAFLYPSIVYSWVFLFGLFFFFSLVTGGFGRAYLAVSMFFFSAGFGFINFLKDLFSSGDWYTWIYPREEYSRFMEYEWGSGNVLVGLLVPQRAFLLGVAFAIWSLTIYIARFGAGLPLKNRTLVVGGVLGGLLAITHVHSLMAIGIVFLVMGLFFIREWKEQMYFAVPMAATALLLHFTYLHGAVNTQDFWVWQPGWTVHSLPVWLKQWSLQWGLTLPAALVGLGWMYKQEPRWKIALIGSFVLLFVLSNLFRFQPVNWDNSKIFLWSNLGLCASCAWLLHRLWGPKPLKALAIVLGILLMFTGALEINRLIQTGNHSHRMISRDDMTFTEKIRAGTPASSVFLTATVHDHPIMIWAARPLFMGYTSWVFNYGFPFVEREQEMVKMFQGDEELLRKNKIDYVVIDPPSMNQFKPRMEFFAKFPVAFEMRTRVVYDVRSLRN